MSTFKHSQTENILAVLSSIFKNRFKFLVGQKKRTPLSAVFLGMAVYNFFFPQPPKPESLCTICYTSGTTGMPKGVMLTHENVVASMCSVIMQLGEHRPAKTDVMISFLPLAHMLERCCEVGEIKK